MAYNAPNSHQSGISYMEGLAKTGGKNNNRMEMKYDGYDGYQEEEKKSNIKTKNVEHNNQYIQLYTALKDLEQYGTKLSVPEFVFLGMQSSGKTSAVSQAAKKAVGVMKTGTASRCPTRFKLISNKDRIKPLIMLNGKECADEGTLTEECIRIHTKWEKENKFSKEIIEVRIESSDVADLTFLDLPGLIMGDNEEYRVAKQQLEEMTSSFLHEMNDDGTYRYMPILVRVPGDKEHDKEEEIRYINEIIKKYVTDPDKQRIGWMKDTLFIVNKFDREIGRTTAKELIEYMEYCCKYSKRTVITMMNPRMQTTATMSHKQLNSFVINVPDIEESKWNEELRNFQNDPDLQRLIKFKNEYCGVGRMNNILEEWMCDIVKSVLPFIEQQLEKTEKEIQNDIAKITKQLEMCDPTKLKQECINFGNKFLKYLREFYDGSLGTWLDPKYKKSWTKECNDFHSINNFKWFYEIKPEKLEKLIKNSFVCNEKKPKQLLTRLNMRLFGTPAVNRIVNAWIAQVSFMSFPYFTDEDIVNMSDGYDATRQFGIWKSIRNVVLKSAYHLARAVEYLGEILRYKLKENADIMFEYTLIQQFGSLDIENNSIIRLLQRTLRDYKAEIDYIIDEFHEDDDAVDHKIAQKLDKEFCQETILLGKLVDKSLYPNKKHNNNNIPRVIRQQNNNIPGPPQSPQSPQRQNSKRYKPRSQTNVDVIIENEDEEKKLSISTTVSKDRVIIQGTDIYNQKGQYDNRFYDAMNAKNFKMDHRLTEIEQIRSVSFAFWTNLKQMVINDTIQKVSNRIMSHIRQQHNSYDRIADAVLVGVDSVRLQSLLNKLVEKTGVSLLKLEKLVKDESTKKIPKSINDLDNEELQVIYGIDIAKLEKLRLKRIKDLHQYQLLKTKTLHKIYRIKNGTYSNNNSMELTLFDNDDDDDDDDNDNDIDDDNDDNINEPRITPGNNVLPASDSDDSIDIVNNITVVNQTMNNQNSVHI